MSGIKAFAAGSVAFGTVGGVGLAASGALAGGGLTSLELVTSPMLSMTVERATGEATISARLFVEGDKMVLEDLDIRGPAGKAAFKAAEKEVARRAAAAGFRQVVSKYPPAEPEALRCEPLKAA